MMEARANPVLVTLAIVSTVAAVGTAAGVGAGVGIAGAVKTKKEKEHEKKLGKTQAKIAAEQTEQARIMAEIAAKEQEAMVTTAAYAAGGLVVVGTLLLAAKTQARKRGRS
jgi:hypothetical protein